VELTTCRCSSPWPGPAGSRRPPGSCTRSSRNQRAHREPGKELGALVFAGTPGVVLTSAGEQLLPMRSRSCASPGARRVVRDETPSDPCASARWRHRRAPAAGGPGGLYDDCPEGRPALVTGPKTTSWCAPYSDYELDGALVTGPVHSPELDESVMVTEQLVVVTSRWCRTHGGGVRGAGRPRLLVFRPAAPTRGLEGWCRRAPAAGKVLEYGTLEGILGCVAAGLGITLLPREVVAPTASASCSGCTNWRRGAAGGHRLRAPDRLAAHHRAEPFVEHTRRVAARPRSGRSTAASPRRPDLGVTDRLHQQASLTDSEPRKAIVERMAVREAARRSYRQHCRHRARARPGR